MSERNNPIKVLNAFSKKFAKMSDEALDAQPSPFSKDKKLQDEINDRESDRRIFLCRRFEDFVKPLTQDIEEDEDNLIKAYDFFCKLTEFCEHEKSENQNTKLRSMELSSPLCRKADYTLGDDMAFLRLCFLQQHPDASVVPEFSRADNGQFYLNFTARELWTPTPLEKEILRALENPED